MRISGWSSDVCSADLVGLDDAGDNVHGWALRRHDKVDARRPGLLRKALDQEFYFLARCHHQVGQLVHNDDYLRQWVEIELFFLIDRLSGIVIVAGLDATTQRLALCLGGTNLLLVVCEIAAADPGHPTLPALLIPHPPS